MKLHQQMKQESEIIESYFQLVDTKKAERNARYHEEKKKEMLYRDMSHKRYEQIREEHSRKMSQSMIESLSQSINHQKLINKRLESLSNERKETNEHMNTIKLEKHNKYMLK